MGEGKRLRNPDALLFVRENYLNAIMKFRFYDQLQG